VTESLGRQCNVLQRGPFCSCPQLNLGHVRSRMMKSAIIGSSSTSQRRMNNAPGESGSCAASPNDVHNRCRWQGNGHILVLHSELHQELAQFPEAGQPSCFIAGTVRTQYYLSTPICGQCARLPRPASHKPHSLLPHYKGALVGEEDEHPVVDPRPTVPRPRGLCPCWQTRRNFLGRRTR